MAILLQFNRLAKAETAAPKPAAVVPAALPADGGIGRDDLLDLLLELLDGPEALELYHRVMQTY